MRSFTCLVTALAENATSPYSAVAFGWFGCLVWLFGLVDLLVVWRAIGFIGW